MIKKKEFILPSSWRGEAPLPSGLLMRNRSYSLPGVIEGEERLLVSREARVRTCPFLGNLFTSLDRQGERKRGVVSFYSPEVKREKGPL